MRTMLQRRTYIALVSLAGYDAEIAEGSGHVGPSALIDLVAMKRKPAAG